MGTLASSAVEPVPGSDDADGVLYLCTVIDAVPSSVRPPSFSAKAGTAPSAIVAASTRAVKAVAILPDNRGFEHSIVLSFQGSA